MMPNTEHLFEKAIRLLCFHFTADKSTYPSWLFLNTQIGSYLYNHQYPKDIIIAGLLSNTMEITNMDFSQIAEEFSSTVARLVQANTTDDSIEDAYAREVELINNCVEFGEESLILKAAQILTHFRYFKTQEDNDGMDRCRQSCHFLRSVKPEDFEDDIFPFLFKKVLKK